jgi:rubredoxin
MCVKSRIGQIYTTTWRSILIKGISLGDIEQWKMLLIKHGISTRHAATELNWQTEDLCESGLNLKLALSKEFDQEDLATGDLCFAIKMNPKAGLFGSVIIRKVHLPGETEERQLFDILHTTDFNPNSKKLVDYRNHVTTDTLGEALAELCRYYADQNVSAIPSTNIEPQNVSDSDTVDIVFQCRFCLSIYDEQTGDESQCVASGTSFRDLPDAFCCPLCEAEKSAFLEIERHKIYM